MCFLDRQKDIRERNSSGAMVKEITKKPRIYSFQVLLVRLKKTNKKNKNNKKQKTKKKKKKMVSCSC